MICELCPRRCGAERNETEGRGVCRMPAAPVVARAALHQWEEPVISGEKGSGAVFFSGCSLHCVFCQNGPISAGGYGKVITPKRLRAIFEELIAQGAHAKEIQERLGHSTIRLTFDRYGHLLPSLDERLRDGLEETFRRSVDESDESE